MSVSDTICIRHRNTPNPRNKRKETGETFLTLYSSIHNIQQEQKHHERKKKEKKTCIMNDTSTRDSVRRVSRSRGFTNTTFKDRPTSTLIVIHLHAVFLVVVVGFWLVCWHVSEVCCHVVVGFAEERVSVSEKGEERVVMVYENELQQVGGIMITIIAVCTKRTFLLPPFCAVGMGIQHFLFLFLTSLFAPIYQKNMIIKLMFV